MLPFITPTACYGREPEENSMFVYPLVNAFHHRISTRSLLERASLALPHQLAQKQARLITACSLLSNLDKLSSTCGRVAGSLASARTDRVANVFGQSPDGVLVRCL